MSLISAKRNRGLTRDFAINNAAGGTITPGANDQVRVTIGREGEAAKLTISSDAPTANGSSFTKGAQNRLRLDASDLNFEPGDYSLTFDYYDNADSQEWKNVDKQVFHLEAM